MQEFKIKKKHNSGTTLITSNKDINDIIKIIQTLENSNILPEGATKAVKNETREQGEGFLGTLLGTLGSILLGNLLSGKGIVKGKRDCKSWLWKRTGFLIPPHPLTNFEIQKYYQIEPSFNGVFSRDNLPKRIKDGVYVINLDEYADVGTHWIVLFYKRSEIVYFNSFGVDYVPKEIKEFIRNKNIKANIF